MHSEFTKLLESNLLFIRKNLHHKRIFLRYVTNKVEKESEFLTMVRSNTMPIKANSYKPLSPKKIVKEKLLAALQKQ
jgi:hypothetical protein